MILIGSGALRYIRPDLLKREPSDIDYIATPDEIHSIAIRLCPTFYTRENIEGKQRKTILHDNDLGKTGTKHIELEHILAGSTAEMFYELVEADKDTVIRYGDPIQLIPSLDALFTLKSSHKYLKNSPHFWKTAQDYHNMKAAGAVIRPEYKEFLKAREKETYTYKHPNLKQDKTSFFADDNINYVYDHDTVHKAVAIYDKPAYLYYAVEGEEVESSKEKFFSQPLQIRLAGVIEEAAVLAIERSLVPHPGIKTPKEAWLYALSKVCTSITSGWFRAFAYEYLPYLVDLYPDNYWEKFNIAVDKGLVLPYTKGAY